MEFSFEIFILSVMEALYLNISSDKVELSGGEEELFLERNGIEDVL